MDLSKKNVVVATIGNQHYVTQLQSASHHLVADEPLDHGGSDQGMAPFELLSASLASCTVITLRMYAHRKNWATGTIKAAVSFNVTEDNGESTARFERVISFSETLGEAEINRLRHIVEACPVSKLLRSGNHEIVTIVS